MRRIHVSCCMSLSLYIYIIPYRVQAAHTSYLYYLETVYYSLCVQYIQYYQAENLLLPYKVFILLEWIRINVVEIATKGRIEFARELSNANLKGKNIIPVCVWYADSCSLSDSPALSLYLSILAPLGSLAVLYIFPRKVMYNVVRLHDSTVYRILNGQYKYTLYIPYLYARALHGKGAGKGSKQ